MFYRFLITGLFLLLTACSYRLPEGIQAVDGFDVNRYLGRWYEIARLDHRFERGLDQISAEYRLNPDGSLAVINRGVEIASGEPQEAHGTAYFLDSPDIGSLKVSFFGPFYGAYHIIELDKINYRYALITSSDRDYLWILAREPQLPQATIQALLNKAKKLGFAVHELIYPNHSEVQ